MADIMSAEKPSRLMSRIRSKDTTPERYIADLLLAGGFEFD
jgi:G:T-mismatch repair DNA endonuclease (very short patch repair protein)